MLAKITRIINSMGFDYHKKYISKLLDLVVYKFAGMNFEEIYN